MKQYSIKDIADIVNGKLVGEGTPLIKYLLTDSRPVVSAADSLFFAIKGERHDGHTFINEAFDKGIRFFVVSTLPPEQNHFEGSGFILVENTVKALQKLAEHHRGLFNIPVVGITGSNGKTIVKEWIFSLIENRRKVVRSPKSYNSQIGVPLSVWLLDEHAELAVFEAGISKHEEMEKLQKIIRPDIGIFTNIGPAHQENFDNLEDKVKEKIQLFEECKLLIYCKDYGEIHKQISTKREWQSRTFTWSKHSNADLQVKMIKKGEVSSEIWAIYKGRTVTINIPFTNEAAIENAIHCWVLMLHLGYDDSFIMDRMKTLPVVAMRLELKEGINNCWIINDSYNSDLGSLNIAIDFLNQQKQQNKKTLIISDILQTGIREAELYKEVAAMVSRKGINRIIGIGGAIRRNESCFELESDFYHSTEEFLQCYSPLLFRDEVILLKGAREFNFEKISALLQKKAHNTVLEINLNAITHNLNYFRSLLRPATKVMVMVKAFSYGSGIHEIANLMQFQRVDYLAVAFTDEGVELRKAGIKIPIMVLAPDESGFDAMIEHNLEPEIYCFRVLEQLCEAVKKSGLKDFPVHLELDTGMKRLGFDEKDIKKLIREIKSKEYISVRSVFSHLAGSDEESLNDFTSKQIDQFENLSNQIVAELDYPVMRHILNSAGIERFPTAQFDMVRLGIGLYGISAKSQGKLMNISTLKTTIVQIRDVLANETIGYNRMGKLDKNSRIAIIPIGYADGLSRGLSNSVGKVLINKHFAPIVGNVCMDMCMVDVTGLNVAEGDEVIVFGEGYHISNIAEQLNTIPYEVFTDISRRVKRVYFHE